MALPSPDTGRFTQDVMVNGLTYYEYERYWKVIGKGTSVYLQAQPSNLHDKKAVKVCLMDGAQIGWVPKDANAEISRRLLAGEVLVADVIRHYHNDLVIRVHKPSDVKPAPEVACYAKVAEIGAPSQAPSRLSEWTDAKPGTAFRLRTSGNRSSVSLVSVIDNADIGWFRKDDVDMDLNYGMFAGVKSSNGNLWLFGLDRLPEGTFWPEAPKPKPDDAGLYIGPKGLILNGQIVYAPKIQPTTKETTMNFKQQATTLVDNNKSAAAQAGYLEAGRIANNQFVKLASKSLPMMVRGYADTAVGKLVIANIAQMAAQQLRPNDVQLAKLTGAMAVAAYQQVIQTVDIEGWLNSLMGSPEIQRALGKLPADGAE